MVKAGVNWESTETWQRLVASILASGIKLDLKQVALHFGTTYDTLENRFRKIKKDAAELKQEIESGARGEVTSNRTKSATSTPRKPRSPKALDTVANGRITKTTPSKRATHIVKQELLEPDLSFLTDDFTDPRASFDDTPISFDMSNYENSFIHGSLLGPDDSF